MSWLLTPTIALVSQFFYALFFIPEPTGRVRLLIQSQCMRYFGNQFQKKKSLPSGNHFLDGWLWRFDGIEL
jgi:hypothetical protein